MRLIRNLKSVKVFAIESQSHSQEIIENERTSLSLLLGKSQSMVGVDSSCAEFGVIPTAISWLYHLIENQKNRTGARFSIRISALEIRGKNEELSDLLSDCAAG